MPATREYLKRKGEVFRRLKAASLYEIVVDLQEGGEEAKPEPSAAYPFPDDISPYSIAYGDSKVPFTAAVRQQSYGVVCRRTNRVGISCPRICLTALVAPVAAVVLLQSRPPAWLCSL